MLFRSRTTSFVFALNATCSPPALRLTMPGPQSEGKSSKGNGKGKKTSGNQRHRFQRGEWFTNEGDNRQTAWQYLSRDRYMWLKRSHDWRLDKWSREKNVSWCLTLLLRHGNPYEDRRVQVNPAGECPVEELVSFTMMCYLDVDLSYLEHTLRMTNRGDKCRWKEIRDEAGTLISLSAHQGHSEEILVQIDEEQALHKVTKDEVPRIVAHGTVRKKRRRN